MTKISKIEKGVYATGIAGQNILYNFMSMYIMFFFTDLIGIGSEVATTIIVVATLWDAVNDPMMGLIADKTKTKYGKFRPYLMSSSILLFVTTVLCFTVLNVPAEKTVLVVAVTYILWGMSYTISDIPIWALSSVVSDDPKERTNMVTIGKIGGTIGVVICVLFSVQLLNLFGGERNLDAYRYSSIIVAGIAAISIFITGVVVKERIHPPKETVKMKENIRTITNNKSLVYLLITLFIINLVNGIRQATQLYFTVYVWGDSNHVTSVGIALVVGMLAGMIFSSKLIEKFEKKKIMIATCLVGAFVSSIPFLSLTNVILGLVFLGFSFATIGVMSIVSTSMLLDAIDYSEYKLGFRGDGIVFSMNTFVTKFSSAFAKLMLGLCLILINYTEGQEVTAQTINGFSILMYIVPAIVLLIAILPLMKYSITRSDIEKISLELKERRGD